jgi:hypothetical protein
MDVPTRQAYVMAVVELSERTAAAAYANTARYLTRPVAPLLAGAAIRGALGLPFLLAGALRQANRVRSVRAKLKQDLCAGKVRLEQILATRADYLASAEVFDLLVAVRKIGPVKAGRLLTVAHISPSKTVGELTQRQRTRLIELLSR